MRSLCASCRTSCRSAGSRPPTAGAIGRARSGRTLPTDLELLPGLAVGVDLAGLGLDDDLAAGGGGAQAISLWPRSDLRGWPSRSVAGQMAADPHLPRLSPARDRLQRLQRAPRAALGARRARGAPALPGAAARGARFVDAVGDWHDGRRCGCGTLREPVRVTVYRPDIGRCCPSTSPTATRASRRARCPELQRRRDRGLRAAQRRCGARRLAARARPRWRWPTTSSWGRRSSPGGSARVPYAVKVHGSALEYVVKRDPERFLPWAREGLAGARRVLVGSRHTGESPVGGDAGRPACPSARG